MKAALPFVVVGALVVVALVGTVMPWLTFVPRPPEPVELDAAGEPIYRMRGGSFGGGWNRTYAKPDLGPPQWTSPDRWNGMAEAFHGSFRVLLGGGSILLCALLALL